MGKIYLVTGAAGHLGSNVVAILANRGQKVRALVLPNEKDVSMLPKGVEVMRGDICQPATLEAAFEHPAGDELFVIHCAGIVTIASRFDQLVWDVNVEGTRNIVTLCRRFKARKLVYVSSVHAIPEQPDHHVISEIHDFDPDAVKGLYAKTKAAASRIVMEAAADGSLDASLVHPSGILGPGDHGHGHITQMVIDYCQGRLTAGTTGGYDFVDVRDVAAGTVACCDRGRPHEGYLLSNHYYSVADLFRFLHDVTGLHEVRIMLPRWLALTGAPFCGIYYRLAHQTPLFTSYSIYTLNSNSNFTHAKADAELGYATRPFIETIRDTVASLRQMQRI